MDNNEGPGMLVHLAVESLLIKTGHNVLRTRRALEPNSFWLATFQ